MNQTLGHHLADQNAFFWWLNNTIVSLVGLNAGIRSGLFEWLGDEPVSVEELGAACGIPPDKLARLLYFLAAEEVVSLEPDGRFTATEASHRLSGMAPSLGCAMHSIEAGIPLDLALSQGRTSYELRFGKPVFQHFAEHPDIAQMFAGFMGYMTRLVEDFVFTHHAFASFEVAVDIGGNHGGLLLKLLEYYPGTRGVLFDLPEVTAMVAESVLTAEHGERIEIVGGDFFQAVPAGDLYLLKMILHDWSDAECVAILDNIRRAMRPGGRVAVIDYVLPETPRQHPGNSMDMQMMVWTTGRERRLSEFDAMFRNAGLALARVTENPTGQSVVEAVAA